MKNAAGWHCGCAVVHGGLVVVQFETMDRDGIAAILRDTMPIPFKYKGPLPSGGRKASRSNEKQVIRRQLHKQIVRFMADPPMEVFGLSDQNDRRTVGKFTFQPIICSGRGMTCEIDLKIFSRNPFGPIYTKGDLDNRIKTLFDALCLPNKDQLPNSDAPSVDESLFYVLLQNDSLISDFSVKTEPLFTEGDDRDVEVEMNVTIKKPGSFFR